VHGQCDFGAQPALSALLRSHGGYPALDIRGVSGGAPKDVVSPAVGKQILLCLPQTLLTGREEPAVTGFSFAALASIAAGFSIGAVATVGVTLATADEHLPAQVVPAPAQSGPHLVEYGFRIPAPPCNSVQSCRNKLPPGLR
jgi:hypothetical protein